MDPLKENIDSIQAEPLHVPELVEDSPEIHPETDSKPASLLEKARKYRTEIVIAVSTTCIMTGLLFQGMGVRVLGNNPAILKNPELYRFLSHAMYSPIPQLVFFLIVPVISLILLREPLSKYGFRIGNWKTGLLYAFLSIAALSPLLYWASTMPDFQRYYQGQLSIGLPWLILQFGLYMVSWEFILRGYIYFSLEEKVGALAIFLQSVPFAISHIGKPAPEALTCFFGGLVLGYISMKSRSFLYAFLVHWGIYTTLLTFIYLRLH